MLEVPVRAAHQHIGQEVTIHAWVQNIRNQKTVQFVILRDQAALLQATLEKSEQNAPLNERIAGLTRESVVSVSGTLVENQKVSLGGLELIITNLEVIALADETLPIDMSGRTTSSPEKRLDWRFLDLRRPENQLAFRVQTTAEAAMRDFWLAEGFIEIHSPKLMGSPSESGAELFSLEYFGQTAYLAQSPQFYKQMAMAAGFNRVFEIAPVFRADPSFTSRHATEFTSVDMEMSWINSHVDVMDFEERWLAHVLQTVREKHAGEIKQTFGVEVVVPSRPFPKISMAEAVSILEAQKHVPPSDAKPGDIDPQGERVLCDYVAATYNHEFVFVTDYPTSVRPFYHMTYENDPRTTKSFDLLWKGLEITTGAQREHRYEVLHQQALDRGLALEPIQFYLDFFKYGCPPHGGLGFGLARMLAQMLGQNNIREVTFLHRGPNRLKP
jgi:nondiscriminating aspartyl-tRNA synthetase